MAKNMRFLISGGTGLIGRALAASLVGDGHQVIILSRSLERVGGFPAGVTVKRWDGRTAEGWGTLVEGIDAVVNLAGENISSGRWTPERKIMLIESRLNAGRAIAQAVAMAAVKPRVVVQASAVGYYGPSGDQPIAEDTPAGNDFLAKLCVDWEKSTDQVKALDVRHVILRTGVVLSSQGGALPRMSLPFRLFLGGRLGNGRQWLPWIHIADEIAAIRFLIENETAGGPFNLTAPVPLTNLEFSHLLGQKLRCPDIMPVPAFALRLFFGEMASVLLTGQKAIPSRLLQLGFKFQFPDAASALRNLLLGSTTTSRS